MQTSSQQLQRRFSRSRAAAPPRRSGQPRIAPAHPRARGPQVVGRPQRPFARVSVVIPTLNEAANLPHVFARLPFEELHEVILVDGHSSDDTIAVARALHPQVRVILQDGSGKGNALACGFAAARGDIIVMLDADFSTDPAEIPRYLETLHDGADFAKGSRFIAGAGSVDITPLRRAGNWFLNAVVNVLFGTRYTDLCYGYNAFWAELLPQINVNCDGFEVETLINVRVAKAGLEVAEVPSVEQERIHGESKLRPVRDGLRVLSTIVNERLERTNGHDGRISYRELHGDASGNGNGRAGSITSAQHDGAHAAYGRH
jgi:glycosyltransferase involved in cell wall biosynthesis